MSKRVFRFHPGTDLLPARVYPFAGIGAYAVAAAVVALLAVLYTVWT